MNNLFVTRLDHTNQLINLMEVNSVRSSLYTISGVLFLLIVVSFVLDQRKAGKSQVSNTLFSLDSTLVLKGVAILLLLLGHVSQQCAVGSEAISYRMTANAAVIVFLFVSGVGLAKRYHLHVDKLFLSNRVKRIAMPLWLSLVLVLCLNFFLIGHKDPIPQLLLNFCGIFWTKFPNSPCWFITYILFFYAVYFVAALLPVKRGIQVAVLFLLPLITAWLIVETGATDHFILWPQYSVVFPIGVVCGLYAQQLKTIYNKLFDFSPIVFVAAMLILLSFYCTGLAVYRISHLVSHEVFTQLVFALINPLALILFLILFVAFLETKKLKSGMLNFLGKYSFEVYLLHFPFMVYYDFFLYRKPLVFFFFVYAVFVLMLSVFLQRTAVYLEGFIFRQTADASL